MAKSPSGPDKLSSASTPYGASLLKNADQFESLL